MPVQALIAQRPESLKEFARRAKAPSWAGSFGVHRTVDASFSYARPLQKGNRLELADGTLRPLRLWYFSMPSTEVGAKVLRNFARNCCPCVRSLTHSPETVTHSPAAIAAA